MLWTLELLDAQTSSLVNADRYPRIWESRPGSSSSGYSHSYGTGEDTHARTVCHKLYENVSLRNMGPRHPRTD